MRALLLAFFLVLSAPALAGTLVLDGRAEQGGLVVGATDPGTVVTLDGEPIAVADDGTFLLGFGRDAPPSAVLSVRRPDGAEETRALTIAARDWPTQRIDGLPERQVTPSADDLRRIKEDNRLIGEARALLTRETLFRSGFILPTEGPLSGVFGSQRILNGEPRAPHSGTDIAAPTGTPVRAAADGVVRLVHDDMFYTGKTVMIDHGFGLTSVYAHLSAIDVTDGQRVAQGTPIGAVGATGRVSGAHLHWGVSLKTVKLDPLAVLNAFPAAPRQEASR